MVPGSVVAKLTYAESRLDGLRQLIQQNALASDALGRQQLLQEFCFHAVGATEYLAQLVNKSRELHLSGIDVSVSRVLKRLSPCDPVCKHLASLHARPNGCPFPKDPYSLNGMIYRLVNYRNEVVHRNTNPFHFVLSLGPGAAFLYLDPRKPEMGLSRDRVEIDLGNIFKVVEVGCLHIIDLL